MSDEEAQRIRPLPGLQAVMAEAVAAGAVAYAVGPAIWYEDRKRGEIAVKARGRTLRELRRAGLIVVRDDLPADEHGAFPVELTEDGQARTR